MKKKFNFYIFLLFLVLMACTEKTTEPGSGNGNNSKSIIVHGRIVETFYSDEVIFSVVPLKDVVLSIGEDILAVSDPDGKYKLVFNEEGYYTINVSKTGYYTESKNVVILKGNHLERDFYLQREGEGSHGWHSFSIGARTEICADGLALFSLGFREAYAIRNLRVKNNSTYIFKAKVKKDVMTRRIFFSLKPKLTVDDWITQSWQLDDWRNCEIKYSFNDKTIIDTIYTYIENEISDTIYVYPDSLDIVLKIGVEDNTNFPVGYFTDIKIIKE